MQTFDHAIVMAQPRGMTPQRATGLAFAGLLQAAMIWALIEGLDIKVWPRPEHTTSGEVILDLVKPGLPPLPTPTWHEPTVGNPVEPTFVIDDGSGTGTAITTVDGPTTPSYDQLAAGVAGTHTTPPYPPLAQRLGEEGSVRLRLTISLQGVVTEVLVVHSSGYADLDRAARDWVMAHWRYRPAIRGGAAVASASDVQVRFDLRNAR